MSRYYNMLYLRNQRKREREQSFPPLERNPAWDKEDRERWARNTTLKPEYGPLEVPGPPLCADVAHHGVEAPSAAPFNTPVSETPPAPAAGSVSVAESSAAATKEPEDDVSSINPVEALDNLAQFLREYLVCTHDQLTVLTLWIAHTHCRNVFPHTPYLHIYSPEKQSGKSVCMQLLGMTTEKPWIPSGPTPAQMIRRIINSRPTLLLDDWHASFRPSESQAFISFLNNSSVYGDMYPLFHPGGYSDATSFCPKAFAGKRALPSSLADRCIPIALKRRKPTEPVKPFWLHTAVHPALHVIEPVGRWIAANSENIRQAVKSNSIPPLPALSLRQQELAVPLLYIAHAAGGHWPKKIERALLRILRRHKLDETLGIQLLSDCRVVFAERQDPERIFSKDLVDGLIALDGRPWADYEKHKPLSQVSAARLLREFEITTRSLRIGDAKNRGYLLSQFADAWKCYLPSLSCLTSQNHSKMEGETEINQYSCGLSHCLTSNAPFDDVNQKGNNGGPELSSIPALT